jgi:ribose 5-phosphate isomerase B
MKTLIFGSDHAGLSLKNFLTSVISVEYDINIIDIGTFNNDSCDYPDYAKEVCESVLNIENSLGILICGTGIGMSIAANKIKNIRCANCCTEYMAVMARKHNNANVISIGARTTSGNLAFEIVKSFLTTEFEGDRHKRRIDKLKELYN